MSAEKRLKQLGIELGAVSAPVAKRKAARKRR